MIVTWQKMQELYACRHQGEGQQTQSLAGCGGFVLARFELGVVGNGPGKTMVQDSGQDKRAESTGLEPLRRLAKGLW